MRLALHAREARVRPNLRLRRMETNLIATGRFRSSSKAAYTLPAPPEPRSVPTRYRPIFRPAWGTNRSSGASGREVAAVARLSLPSRIATACRMMNGSVSADCRKAPRSPAGSCSAWRTSCQIASQRLSPSAGKADLPTGLRLPSWHHTESTMFWSGNAVRSS